MKVFLEPKQVKPLLLTKEALEPDCRGSHSHICENPSLSKLMRMPVKLQQPQTHVSRQMLTDTEAFTCTAEDPCHLLKHPELGLLSPRMAAAPKAGRHADLGNAG